VGILHPESFYSQINIVHFDTIFATIVAIEKSLLNVITVCNYKTMAVAKEPPPPQGTMYCGEISIVYENVFCVLKYFEITVI
jgi:hypothetical protein